MPTKLDQLLESIHPDRLNNGIDSRIDDAINRFPLASVCITQWGEFEDLCGEFLGYLENRVLGLPADFQRNRALDIAQAWRKFQKLYGPNGEKAAFQMARTGVEGGLLAVLRDLARAMAEQYAQNEISTKVYRYWNSLSLEEKLAAPDEYLEKHGHLLPSDITEGSAARLRAYFPKFLQEHPRLMQKLRRIGH